MKSFGNAKKDYKKCQLQGEFREDGANPLAWILRVGSKP
jgi:hypothetical protein